MPPQGTGSIPRSEPQTIGLHWHILPGLGDGSPGFGNCIAMARQGPSYPRPGVREETSTSAAVESSWGARMEGGGTYAVVSVDRDRFQALPRREVLGRVVPVATTFRSRLLGLAGLTREQAGAGLLIPRCAGVHTFAMRFELDLIFLDGDDRELAVRRGVPPRRLAWHRAAVAVLEIPTPRGESSAGAAT